MNVPTPGKPYQLNVSAKTVKLEWEKTSDITGISHFNIKYQMNGEKRWNSIDTKGEECCITVSDLQPDTNYIFKVRCVLEDDTEGPFGEVSDTIQTFNDQASDSFEMEGVKQSINVPGKPKMKQKTHFSVLMGWDQPQSSDKFDHFEVKYELITEPEWCSATTKETNLLFTDLKSDAKYIFKVRIVFQDDNGGQFSPISDEIKTRKSPTVKIKNKATKVDDGPPKIYRIPVKKEFGNNYLAMTRKCIVLNENPDPRKAQKTILVVGATGSGKSTLIEGMLNYILDVSWNDNARFKLIDLKGNERQKKGQESESQTEWITSYCLNWMPGYLVDFNLNIIDTPGFGDTRGIKRDKELVEQLRTFFTSSGDQGVDELDAVCFVIQAPLCRLTPTMRYIYDSILSLFGLDIKKNIFILVTFAHGDEPPVINSLKSANIPFEKTFIFNNSALFVNPDKSPYGQLFWKMGMSSFEDFFEAIRNTPPRSLILTTRVLNKRKELELDIINIQQQLKLGTNILAIIRHEEAILDRNKMLVEANKNFTYKTKKIVTKQVNLRVGQHTTTCLKCNRTGHENCGIADDNKKIECWVMTDSYCRICPGKCFWDVHKNLPFKYVDEVVEVTGTYEELKNKYEEAIDEAGKSTTLLDIIKAAFNKLRTENLRLVNKVKRCVDELEMIETKSII